MGASDPEALAHSWPTSARRRGIRYSHLPTPSVEPNGVWVQNVRFISEALGGRQANCVEGSCLLASVFAKIGLETSLVLLPGHMLVGVSLDPAGKRQLYLETTMLEDSTFEEAASVGEKELAAAYETARKTGVMPIPDSDAARQQFFQTK